MGWLGRVNHLSFGNRGFGLPMPSVKLRVLRRNFGVLLSNPTAMNPISGAARAHPDCRIAIIASRWNPRIVDALVNAAERALLDHGVDAKQIDLIQVPGAWEIPAAAAHVAQQGRHAAILALGCVVRGDTRHYEHVADGCAQGLMQVAITHRIPVLNGVLAVERHADAEARAGGVHGNKGEEVALAALEMIDLWRNL